MAELTRNEKRLLATLEHEKKTDAHHLARILKATQEAVGIVCIDMLIPTAAK